MKRRIVLSLLTLICVSWSIPKPMESIENYNVMIVHGAYSACQGFWIERDSTSCEEFLAETDTNEAYYADGTLENGATLGAYDNENRITNWVSTVILEERGWKDKNIYAIMTTNIAILSIWARRFLIKLSLLVIEITLMMTTHIVPIIETIWPTKEVTPYTSTCFQLVSKPMIKNETRLMSNIKTAVTKHVKHILCNKEYLIFLTSSSLK